jgi:hypothetical protein
LDLVDSDHAHLHTSPTYRTTYVYGNILIEPDGAGNSQICHYGGDSGVTSRYRQGTLHFYNNTIVSTRTGNTTLLRLSTANETCDCRNNIVYTTAGGSRLAIVAENGTANLRYNWLNTGWRDSFDSPGGTVVDLGGNITGTDPGFVDRPGQDFRLAMTSPCTNAATSLAGAVLPDHAVTNEYATHRGIQARYDDGALDQGAFEFNPDSDFDGMPDWWELLYVFSLTNMAAATDFDGDGLLDREEYVAGTVPTNRNSCLRITDIDRAGAGKMLVRWLSVTNRVYGMTSTSNLVTGPWTNMVSATNLPGVQGVMTWTNDAPAPGRESYRVTVELK